jgi:hypothetical protein
MDLSKSYRVVTFRTVTVNPKFLCLNQPFIEVAYFENTMTNDSEILPANKMKIPNTPK